MFTIHILLFYIHNLSSPKLPILSCSKLILSWYVGQRDAMAANEFMHDVAARISNKIQLTTDAHHAYLEAVDNAFHLDIDYAMLVKMYGSPTGESTIERKYSPGECNGTKRKI